MFLNKKKKHPHKLEENKFTSNDATKRGNVYIEI